MRLIIGHHFLRENMASVHCLENLVCTHTAELPETLSVLYEIHSVGEVSLIPHVTDRTVT